MTVCFIYYCKLNNLIENKFQFVVIYLIGKSLWPLAICTKLLLTGPIKLNYLYNFRKQQQKKCNKFVINCNFNFPY